MKNVLITGAGGFIGSHLVEQCVREGLTVKALVRYNARNEWGWLESSSVKNEIEVVAGDVRDYDLVRRAVEGVDSCLHLAALIGIPYSYVSPLAYVRTNVEGTYNVLEAARAAELETIVVTSTSETYGSAQYVPIDETHPVVGQSPYSASKIAADQLAISYHRSFGLPVKIARPFNTFGPRQSARAIIPTVISQLLNGFESLELGNTAPTRDFTFVKDTVAGMLAIARCTGLIGETTNIGSGREISMGDLVQLISGVVGRPAEIVVDSQRVRPKGSEVDRLCCESSKLRSATGWALQYDLESGLRETVEWMRGELDKYKSSVYNT